MATYLANGNADLDERGIIGGRAAMDSMAEVDKKISQVPGIGSLRDELQ